jgi:hypothetical protein
MLFATTLIAIGAGTWAFLFRGIVATRRMGVDSIMLWIVGGAFIGAGILTPFKRPWEGAIVAIVFQFLLVAVAAILYLR